MHVSKSLRRLAVVAVTSSLLGAVPFVAPASAASSGYVVNVSPNAQSNTGSVIVTFTTQHKFLPTDGDVAVTRTGASTDTLTVSDVSASQNTITATINAQNANPGTYDITVDGAAVPEVGETPPYVDSCTACFTVLAFKPDVTSLSPNTIGGNGTKLVTINGTNFTTKPNWDYCSGASCAGKPTLAVSPPDGISIFATLANGDKVTDTSATAITRRIVVAAGATPGPRDVIVTNTDGKSDTCVGCLVVGPTPTVTNVSPAALARDASRNVVFTGTNFASGVTAVIRTIGGTDPDANITAGTLARNSDTQVTIPLTIKDAAAVGPRQITFTNPDGGTVVTTAFSVNAKPTVTGVTHSDATPTTKYGQGARNRTLTITGTGFQLGATVAIATPAGITVNTTTVDSPTQITLNVTLAQAGSSPPSTGDHAVTVTNPDGGVSTATDQPLSVAVGPTLESVSPASRGRGENVTLVLTGTNFDTTNGVTVAIDDVSNIVETVNSATKVTVTGTVSNALNVAGVKNVTLVNDGNKGTYVCTGCFTVDNLQTNTISPSIVLNDATQNFTVTGSGFATNAVVSLVKTGANSGAVSDIVGTNTQVNVTGTSITTTFPLTGAAPGQWLVRVTNPTSNPGVGTCACKLTVVAAAPSITSVTPDNRGAGAENETITITGTNFLPGAAVTFDNTGITLVGTPTITSTTITAIVNVASTAYHQVVNPLEPEQIHVTNTDSQTDAADFTVNSGPTASTVTPSARARETATQVTLKGENFKPGASLSLSGTGVTIGAVTVTESQVPSEDTAAALFTVAADAPLGAQNVTVRNPDGGRSTCACAFTVNAKPTIGTTSPDKAARGTNTTVLTINGTGFQGAPSVTFSGTGVSAAVTAQTPTSITATVTVANDAPLTTRDITVTNTDGGVATKAAAFKVFTKPDAPTNVSGARGNGQVTVSWTPPAQTGNDPLTGYVVTASPGTASTTVNDGSATNAVVAGLTNGTAYTFTVVAKNAAGDSPASEASQPVTPATVPTAPAAPTATAGEGDASVSWTAPAANGSPITGYTVTSSPGGKTASVNGSTLTAVVSGLDNGTEYTFSVVATNDVGDSAASLASNAVKPYTKPNAPTAVAGTPADGAVHVTWAAPAFDGGSPVTSYTVTSAPGGLTASTPDGSTTNATVTGLANGTAYTFTVVATNARGTSAASAASDAVTPFTKPGAPTAVAGTPGDGKVTVTWTAPESDGGNAVSGYTVTASPGGASATVAGDKRTADVTGLVNGTPYTFVVTATNAAGGKDSAPSAAVTPRTVPGAPATVTATRGDQSATVSWTAPVSDGGSSVTGYTVTASPGGATVNAAADATQAVVNGLTNGTAYTFTVVAKNVAGDGAASAPSAAVTPAGLPSAPTSVVATKGQGSAGLSWTAPGANGSPITGYTVTASPGGATKQVTGTSTVFSGLTNGTTYTFAVTATNGVGTGAAGTSNAVTPKAITTMDLSATSQIVSGSSTTVSVYLTKSPGTPLSGQPVRIYAMVAPSQTYALVRTVTTGADGTAATTFALTKTTKFVAVYLGSTANEPYRSVERTTKVAYKVTANYSLSGRTLTTYGTVAPNAAGRLIYLRHRKADGTFTNLGQATVQSNGTYKIVKALAPGAYNLSVLMPAGTTNVAGQSPYRALTIK